MYGRRKSSSSDNRLSLNEPKQGQEKLIEHNVLFSEMLRETHTCDTDISPWAQNFPAQIGFLRSY